VEDRAALEVSARGHPVDPHERAGPVGSEYRFDLLGAPHVEGAFLSLRVRIAGGMERARRRTHVGEQVAEHLLGHRPEVGRSGEPVGVDVEPGQERVVVEHLLEVRHEPPGIHRIPVEAAGQLVPHPAGRHGAQGVLELGQGTGVAAPRRPAKHHLQRDRLGKLGCRAESTVLGVVAGGERSVGAVQECHVGIPRRPDPGGLGERLHQPPTGLEHLGTTVAVRIRDALQDLPERRHSVPRLGRVVGAAVEGDAVGRQPDRERPPRRARHGLHRLDVDLVDVGSLLAVDLHAHEKFVHERGRGRVLERLALHHVAPVARRVSHG
jgi:hypothetical protein